MEIFDQLVEERILIAQRQGEFERLPGTGRPLELDDDSLVPPELRMAYRILKNAGFVPAEVTALKELRQLLSALDRTENESADTGKGRQRLSFLLHRLEEAGLGQTSRAILAEYEDKLLQRLSRV